MRRRAPQRPPTRSNVRPGASAHRGAVRALEGEPVSEFIAMFLICIWAVVATVFIVDMHNDIQHLEHRIEAIEHR